MKNSAVSLSGVSTSYSRQREVPRYTFIAVTEIVESSSQTCILAKTSKISCKGCYVETPTPLPVGTSLKIVISHDQESFTTKGEAIYVNQGSGMGVVFLGPSDEQLQTLNYWIAEHPSNTDAV